MLGLLVFHATPRDQVHWSNSSKSKLNRTAKGVNGHSVRYCGLDGRALLKVGVCNSIDFAVCKRISTHFNSTTLSQTGWTGQKVPLCSTYPGRFGSLESIVQGFKRNLSLGDCSWSNTLVSLPARLIFDHLPEVESHFQLIQTIDTRQFCNWQWIRQPSKQQTCKSYGQFTKISDIAIRILRGDVDCQKFRWDDI